MTLDEGMDVAPSMSTVAGTDTMSNNPQDALEESGMATAVSAPLGHPKLLRSRKSKDSAHKADSKRHRRRRRLSKDFDRDPSSDHNNKANGVLGSKCCTCDRTLVRSTLSCMNLLAKLLFWCSALASVAAVVWYSYELKKHGTDPHLIAWFSAGAFVLLGFPISMYGIVMHLANYNQPNVQMYVVRILWMVPIYSIESWLCLRYKDYAIYIETLRDCYESYVLYSFLQFLIQVLGGEETLILMLKDKSPTRGVHMWGLQWCVKPWLMGQPLRKTYETVPLRPPSATAAIGTSLPVDSNTRSRALKRVHWTSPFFVKCKFGVLQYVLLKFLCSIAVMILERYHIYKEGDFTPKGGYLYICILTNLSQCWALYCLIFFYYATKNELSSIRPVGKFLSVKALVFFTWWQSVMISMLYQMEMIPHYPGGTGTGFTSGGASSNDIMVESSKSMFPLSAEDATTLDELGGKGLADQSRTSFFTPSSSAQPQEWSAEDVAKGIQDYLICIEMFVAAIVHFFVFSHTEYDPQAVEARTRALNQTPHRDWNKRLGRKWKEWDNKSGYSGTTTTSSDGFELMPKSTTHSAAGTIGSANSYDEDDDLRIHPLDRLEESRDFLKEGDEEEGETGDEDHDDDDHDDDEHRRERKPLIPLDPIYSEHNDSDHDEHGSSSSYSLQSSVLHDDNSFPDDVENPSPQNTSVFSMATVPTRKTGFVRALLDSAIPQDLRDNTVGIIKGDYVVEKKTLLHHAATSDSYDLFSRVKPRSHKPTSIFAITQSSSQSTD